jgi:predicted AAA+ superfamily ATPase
MLRKSLNDLKVWRNSKKRKPLIIKGARQIGKTYLLKEFGKSEFVNFHYFNFEERKDLNKFFETTLNPKDILEKLSIFSQREINIKKDLLIFDEIQYCPKALTSLKYFNEGLPELAICSAGSLLGLGLEIDSFPVGKVDFLNMFPMSFSEFLIAAEGEKSLKILSQYKDDIPDSLHEHLWSQMKFYFITGGMPEVVKTFIENKSDLKKAFHLVREQQKFLIISYLSDIAKHCGKENAMHIERLWNNIPSQLSREQNGQAPKFKLRGQIPRIKGFEKIAGALDWLNKANLIIKIPIINCAQIPFSAYTEESKFKLFMFDIGLLGAMSNLPPESILEYDYGTYKGYFAENFVAQELSYIEKTKNNLFAWKENTAEVEFIKLFDGKKAIPIEVKSGWVTHSKSASVFQEKYKSPFKIVLSGKNLDLKNKTVKFIPLYLTEKINDLSI